MQTVKFLGPGLDFLEKVRYHRINFPNRGGYNAIALTDNGASKTALLRSATQFAHTCASVGEFARVMTESKNSRKEGNALKIANFIFIT